MQENYVIKPLDMQDYKFNFIEKIFDFRKPDDFFVAGGFFTRHITNTWDKSCDIDVYFQSDSAIDAMLVSMENKFNQKHEDIFESIFEPASVLPSEKVNKFRKDGNLVNSMCLLRDTPNSKQFTFFEEDCEYKVDFVKLNFNSLEETLESFDFNVCKFGADRYSSYSNLIGIEDLKNKRLTLTKNASCATIFRIGKYLKTHNLMIDQEEFNDYVDRISFELESPITCVTDFSLLLNSCVEFLLKGSSKSSAEFVIDDAIFHNKIIDLLIGYFEFKKISISKYEEFFIKNPRSRLCKISNTKLNYENIISRTILRYSSNNYFIQMIKAEVIASKDQKMIDAFDKYAQLI